MHAACPETGRDGAAPAAGRGPVATFLCLSIGLAAGVAAASTALAGEWTGRPVLGFALAATLVSAALARGWRAPRLGWANAVTLLRLALAMLLIVPISRPEVAAGGAGWAVLALALATLALDGVDGRLARRSGLAGPWGARFDMEVDAVFALLLAAAAWRTGAAGPWVLLLGGLRYVFVLATLALPWLDRPLPARFRRKAICVVQIGTLVALLAPVAAPPLSTAAAVATLGLLVWSFAVDALWLARRR